MPRNILIRCLLVAMSGNLVLGCGTFGQRKNYPDDPLLLSKKPVLGRAQDARPVLLARAEPVPPAGPTLTLAATPKTGAMSTGNIASTPGPEVASPSGISSGSTSTSSVSTFKSASRPGTESPAPVIETSSSTRDVPAIPAVRTKETSSVPAVTAVERQVSGNYGNAADYSWLRGVVDKHYQGHLYLRYCDHSVEDTWGGKVCLLDDPRLAQLKDGDVIQVEGEIVPDHDQASRGPWHHYPRYQIRDLKVIQPKN